MNKIFQTTKPLIWERLKNTKRFGFLEKNKVIHIVADDLMNQNWKSNEW